MIIVRFTSGLGNQMFQYNLYNTLLKRFPDVEVKADISWFDQFSEHQGYELCKLFKRDDNNDFVINIASAADIYKCTGQFHSGPGSAKAGLINRIYRYPNRVLRVFNVHTRNRRRIDQTGFEDNAEILKQIEAIDPTVNYYITGFFIEEVYYKDRLKDIRGFFRFDNNLNTANLNYVNQIKSSQAISIHVRRGDYLSDTYKDSFLSLSMDYYKEAVARVGEKFSNPVFYIFSDDKDYMKEAFSWLDNKVIIEGNTGSDSYRDLQLMSMCKANITANSTFSTWAGLLNDNEDAMVIYPAIYMNQKESEIKSINGWVRI